MHNYTLVLNSALDGGGWSMPRPHCLNPGKDQLPIVQEGGWVGPGPARTGAENLAPTGILSPDQPARSELLYRLRYPGLHPTTVVT